MDKSGNVLVLSCDDPQMERKMKEHDICDVAGYKLFPSKDEVNTFVKGLLKIKKNKEKFIQEIQK